MGSRKPWERGATTLAYIQPSSQGTGLRPEARLPSTLLGIVSFLSPPEKGQGQRPYPHFLEERTEKEGSPTHCHSWWQGDAGVNPRTGSQGISCSMGATSLPWILNLFMSLPLCCPQPNPPSLLHQSHYTRPRNWSPCSYSWSLKAVFHNRQSGPFQELVPLLPLLRIK